MTESAEPPQDTPEEAAEAPMDIHKPKAAHSWREFAIEIGTIICGILIALGLEQAIEVVHRGNEVREAREALRDEISADMAVAASNIRGGSCDMRYIPRYIAWAHGGPAPPPDGRLFPFVKSSVWEISKNAVALMPLEERRAFAEFYATTADYNTMVDRQRSLALRAGEAYGLDKLTPENRQELLRAMTGYRGASGVVDGIAGILITRGAAVGAKTGPVPPNVQAKLEALCKMADAPTPKP